MIGEIVSKLNNTVISTTNPIPSYLDYSVTYSDGTPIATNHLLAANSTETYKVRVEFKRDIEETDLPTTDQTNTFSFGVSYVQRDTGAISVPHPATVYTINRRDENNQENTTVWIGQSIPTAITQYSSVAEVRAALNTLAGGTAASPVYLKHTILNNTVTASYVEFVITEDLATEYPSMTAGTYTLQGEAMCEWDSVNQESINCSEEDSEYYSMNITTLQTAFGAFNCSTRTNSQGEYYSCSAGDLYTRAHSIGFVGASAGDWGCVIYANGRSNCEGTPSLVGGN